MTNPKDVESFMESHGFEKSSRVEGEWWKYSANGVLETYATTDQATYWYEQTQLAVREATVKAYEQAWAKCRPGTKAWELVGDLLFKASPNYPQQAPDTKQTDKENV